MRLLIGSGVAIAALALGGAAAARAATVTLGPPTLASSSSFIGCGGGGGACDPLGMQRSVSAPSVRIMAPADGVITGWRVFGQTSSADIRLRVLRPGSGSAVTPVATSAAATDVGGSVVNATNLPVSAGDRVGVEVVGPGSGWVYYATTSGGSFDLWDTAPPDGNSATPSSSNTGVIQLNADVQLAVPTVAGVSPKQGSTAGGDTVTINGDHLANASGVTFGGQPATIVSNTNSAVVVTTPPGTPGNAAVRVTAPGGTAAASFTYVAPPTLPAQKPSLAGLGASHSVFAVAGAPTPRDGATAAASHPKGTTFAFQLDQPALIAVTMQLRTQGRRVGRKCRRTTHKNRTRKRCTLYRSAGTLRRTGHAGHNSIPFSGRIGSKALKPRRYRARFSATTATGISIPRAVGFRIVRR